MAYGFLGGKTGILSPLRFESAEAITNPSRILIPSLHTKAAEIQRLSLRKDRDSNPGYP